MLSCIYSIIADFLQPEICTILRLWKFELSVKLENSIFDFSLKFPTIGTKIQVIILDRNLENQYMISVCHNFGHKYFNETIICNPLIPFHPFSDHLKSKRINRVLCNTKVLKDYLTKRSRNILWGNDPFTCLAFQIWKKFFVSFVGKFFHYGISKIKSTAISGISQYRFLVESSVFIFYGLPATKLRSLVSGLWSILVL